MTRRKTQLAAAARALSAVALLGCAAQARAAEITWDRLLNADRDPNNWLTYHGSFKGWHYSALDQINKSNVRNLSVAWTHTPAPARRGIQSFPVVADGVLYYASATGEVWALDAATGAPIWSYSTGPDPESPATTPPTPCQRGLAIGYGQVYFGTADGRVIALDQKTGLVTWDKTILGAEQGDAGFTGAPLIVKDKVVIGANGGVPAGCCGPIFALNAHTGEVAWRFDAIGGDRHSQEARGGGSWSGSASWPAGAGGGWTTGTFDRRTNSVWWGAAHPAHGLDGLGESGNEGARPGASLYQSAVVVLDADTGRLKAHFSEMPHDAWGFGSALGEFVQIDRGGKRYMVHPNKSGAIFAYNADAGTRGDQALKVENAYLIGKTYNLVQGVNPRTGELVGRRELPPGRHTNVCPGIEGAISWNSGAYNPNNGLYYRTTQEWCYDLDVQPVERPAEASGGPAFNAIWTVRHPESRQAFGTLQAFDPISGKKKWEVELKYPPLASLLTTRGGLLFVPGADGMLYALDADTGAKLWQHHNGLGHHGGVISYSVKGRQYVAVVTGWGSQVSDNYAPLFGEPFTSMATEAGQLLVFAVK